MVGRSTPMDEERAMSKMRADRQHLEVALKAEPFYADGCAASLVETTSRGILQSITLSNSIVTIDAALFGDDALTPPKMEYIIEILEFRLKEFPLGIRSDYGLTAHRHIMVI